jgi:hypothetical protein
MVTSVPGASAVVPCSSQDVIWPSSLVWCTLASTGRRNKPIACRRVDAIQISDTNKMAFVLGESVL